jgi:hypothetical protein
MAAALAAARDALSASSLALSPLSPSIGATSTFFILFGLFLKKEKKKE